MIQGIVTYEFVLNQQENGDIEPEFKPIQLVFQEKKFSADNYSDLIVENDIFSILYQHTTGVVNVSGGYSNFYIGRLKETIYQVISYYKQSESGSKYLAITIFSLDDEIGIYEDLIKSMINKLDTLFETLEKGKITRQTSLILNIKKKNRR